jgi:MFS family permease
MRLITILLLLLSGILAGTQLGKVAPLVGWYRGEIGFSLVLTGWFTALIGAFVALAALPCGLLIERVGFRRSYVWSSIVLAAGAMLLAVATPHWLILAARLVEGAGYLVLVIAIPALLNTVPAPRWRAPALAVWGGFVAVGFALGDFLAAWLDAAENPRTFLAVVGLLFAVFAAASAIGLMRVADSDEGQEPSPHAGPARGDLMASMTMPVVLVSLAFGIYVVISVGFFAFLPTLVSLPASGILLSAGAISLTVPIGNAIAGVAMRGRGAGTAIALSAAGFALTALLAYPAFAGDAATATAAVVLFAVAGGLVAAALFASIPFIVPAGGSAAVAIGLICQAGGIGTLIGPPLAAYFIQRGGWEAFALFVVVTAVAGILACLPLAKTRALPPAG